MFEDCNSTHPSMSSFCKIGILNLVINLKTLWLKHPPRWTIQSNQHNFLFYSLSIFPFRNRCMFIYDISVKALTSCRITIFDESLAVIAYHALKIQQCSIESMSSFPPSCNMYITSFYNREVDLRTNILHEESMLMSPITRYVMWVLWWEDGSEPKMRTVGTFSDFI